MRILATDLQAALDLSEPQKTNSNLQFKCSGLNKTETKTINYEALGFLNYASAPRTYMGHPHLPQQTV